MLGWELNVQTGMVPRYYQDGTKDFGQSVEAADLKATLTLRVEATAQAVTQFYDKWRAQTVDFYQVKAIGPIIAAAVNYSASSNRPALHRRQGHRRRGQRREHLQGHRRDSHRRLMGEQLQRRHRLHTYGADGLSMPGSAQAAGPG